MLGLRPFRARRARMAREAGRPLPSHCPKQVDSFCITVINEVHLM